MNTQLDSFETALLHELRAVVAHRAPAVVRRPRRPGRLVLAGAGVAAATVGALLVVPGIGAQPAFAVSQGANGDVHVEVDRIEDAAGLQRALEDHGVTADVTYLDFGTMCAPGRFDVAPPNPLTGPLTFGMGPDGYRVDIPAGLVLDGQTLVISTASHLLDHGIEGMVDVQVAAGAVGPCVRVDAPPAPAPLAQ